MNTHKTFTICILFVLFFIDKNFAQINEELKEQLSESLQPFEIQTLQRGDNYFLNREYLMALPYYDTIAFKRPENIYIQYLLGICYAYDATNQKNSPKKILAAESIKDKLPDYDYFLAKAYMEVEKYDEAIALFMSYKKNPLQNLLKEEIDHQIRICTNAKESEKKFSLAKIKNIGSPVNTKDSEYGPVFPSDESFMVFTYRGEKSKGGKQSLPGKKDEKKGIYFEDVFISYKGPRGEWSTPLAIDAINTNGHDAVINISHDGTRLFIYRNTNEGNGDIYESQKDGSSWTKPEKVKGINSKAWEGSVCLSPDQQTIYFSSERPGGFGGRDIYFSILQKDGTWSKPANLGPAINTKFDEDAPFIHSDGKALFFTSNGHNTIGGFDIFRSELKDGKWQKPYNVGKPVNTTGDDKFYFVSPDGQRGYYSSEKSDGFGQQDIYMVEPGMFGKPTSLVMVSGKVSLDEMPVDADIKVISKLYKKDFTGIIKSNKKSGEYLLNLPSGYDFEISYTVNNITQTKSLSTALVDSFAKLVVDAELYSEAYLNKHILNVDSTQLKSDDMNKTGLSMDEFIVKYGHVKADSLKYYVQIGAYRSIEKFNYASLIGLPLVQRKLYQDGITRFTIGELNTINEAFQFCNKAKKKGLKDAFVIAIYKGKRMSFNELIKEGILQNQ